MIGATGRKSKGDRQLLGTRPPAPLAVAARKSADKLGMTVNDNLITLLARDLNLPEFAPKPADAGMVDNAFSG